MASPAPSSAKETYLERARALVPALRERAEQTEALRRIPDRSIAELRDAGLFRILQPARVGGAELEFGALLEISEALAHGCASTAWVFAHVAGHNWMLGMWPPKAQDE